jgi:hypothetical protein
VQREFPLLTMSVAALDSQTEGATSADAIAHLLAHVKKIAKQRSGNSFVLRSGERLMDLMHSHRSTIATSQEGELSGSHQLLATSG